MTHNCFVPIGETVMPCWSNPPLFLDDRGDEAIAFYQKAIGANVLMQMRSGYAPRGADGCVDGWHPPSDIVMHACLQIGKTQVMLSDGFCSSKPEFRGISLSLNASDDVEARRLFNSHADGGRITQALVPSFLA